MFENDKKFNENMRKLSNSEIYDDFNSEKNKCWRKVLDDLERVADENDKAYFFASTSKQNSNKETSASPMVIKNINEPEMGATVSLMLTEFLKSKGLNDEERNEFLNAVVETVNTASVFVNGKDKSDKELDKILFKNKEMALHCCIEQLLKHLNKNNKHKTGYFFMTFPNIDPDEMKGDNLAELCMSTDLDDLNFMSMLVLAILQECKSRNMDVEKTMEDLHMAVMRHNVDDVLKETE